LASDVKRVEDLFLSALKRPAQQRAAFLEAQCGADTALRQRLDELLAAQEASDVFEKAEPPPSITGAAAPGLPPGPEAAAPAPETFHYVGDYELLEEIGRGGMGVVYRARQISLNRIVALKMILTGRLANPDDVQRFRREAEATARLNHPAIVPVYEVGLHQGHHYFSMALVEGKSLANIVGSGQWSVGSNEQLRWAAQVLAQVARAIDYAHQRGILHRDLKPANILLTQPEPACSLPTAHRSLPTAHCLLPTTAMITDFGLAKCWPTGLGTRATDAAGGPISNPAQDLTVSGQVLGTPSYIPPEQAGGRRDALGPWTDVYSLGAILYYLLTGRPPFQSDNPMGTLMQMLQEEPAAPRQLNAAVPRDLETICLKCLQKEPCRRYATAAALADDLERWLGGQPILARPISTLERSRRWCRRNPLVAALFLLVCLVFCGAALALYFARVAAARFHQAQAHAQRADTQAAEARRSSQVAQEEAAKTQKEKARADAQTLRLGHDLYVGDMRLALQAWQDARIVRLQELLDGHRPEPTFAVDLRGFEWHYWQRLCHTDLFTLGQAGGLSVAFSPDGTRLASAGRNGVLMINAVDTGQPLLALPGHRGTVWTAVFSPDGKLLASGTGEFGNKWYVGEIRIWDASTGQELLKLRGHPCSITSLAFSPDGATLASASADRTVKIWNTATGQELFSLETGVQVNGLTFSPDGKRLALACEEGAGNLTGQGECDVTIVDLTRGKGVLALRAKAGRLGGVTFSRDSKRLAACGDSAIKVWDAMTGKEALTIPLSPGGGRTCNLVFSLDGRRLVSGHGSIVKIWDAATGQELLALRGHRCGIVSVASSPDGRRLASADGGQVKVWDIPGSQQEPLAFRGDPRWWLAGVSFSPDGTRVAAGVGDATVKICEPGTSREMVLTGHTQCILDVAFSQGGQRLASASADKTVKIWDTATGREILTLTGHVNQVNAVAFSPDGTRLVSASGDCTQTAAGEVKLWDAVTGREIRSFTLNDRDGRPRPRICMTSVAFSPDGSRLAAGLARLDGSDGSDSVAGSVCIWDTATGQQLLCLDDCHQVNSIAFSPDGARLAAACSSGCLKIWDTTSGLAICTFKGHTSRARGVAFSPGGKRVASTSEDRTVRVWDATTGQEALTLQGGGHSVTFSPDGTRLAAVGDHVLLIWDATPPRFRHSEIREATD
jgi:WD40 repeat protein/serine/threonine protein kinase